MKNTVDCLIVNAGEILTCASPGGPRRGQSMTDPGRIAGGALAIDAGRFAAVGPAVDIESRYEGRERIDAGGRSIVPGFVDCHTHAIFGGNRVGEFEKRLQGTTYLEILAAGGGILNTVAATRQDSSDTLAAAARRRLDTMLALGTTTLEIKSGYGLDVASELKMLAVAARLQESHPATVVPTFLGAHTIPAEFQPDPEGYLRLILGEMIPAVSAWYSSSSFVANGLPLFGDVFCEDHAFNPTQTGRILTACRAAGMGLKIHVDQFNELGGLAVALELGATSVDHLEVTSRAGIEAIAAEPAVAVLLPAVNFNLGLTTFARGRDLIDAGAAVALATDLNPGSAPCYAMPLVMAIACRYLGLTPAEALVAATINGAHALAIGDRVGSIEPGKEADCLILTDEDYRYLTYFLGGNPVAQVIKAGKML